MSQSWDLGVAELDSLAEGVGWCNLGRLPDTGKQSLAMFGWAVG
jgi:hypothetical protein